MVPEDAGNILQVAVNRLLGGVKTKQASSIFARQNTSTASPLGSPTAESLEVAPVLTLEEWLLCHPAAGKKKSYRKSNNASQTQIALPLYSCQKARCQPRFLVLSA
jgi:hypothetical protein